MNELGKTTPKTKRLLRMFLTYTKSGSADTVQARRDDLDTMCRFAGWLWMMDSGEVREFTHQHVIDWLVTMGRGDANVWANEYSAWLMRSADNGFGRYAPKSRRRKIAHLRTLLRFAHEAEIIPWIIWPSMPKGIVVNPQDGPPADVVRAMIYAAKDRQDDKGVRDAAILGLMFHAGFRSKEIRTLQVESVRSDKLPPSLMVSSKGLGDDVEEVSVLPQTMDDVLSWMDIRGYEKGVLFTSGRRGKWMGNPLTKAALPHIVKEYAAAVEYRQQISPHRLRHSGITEVILKSGGNLPLALDFSRHSDPNDLLIYYDRLRLDRLAAMQTVFSGQVSNRQTDYRVIATTHHAKKRQ